VDFVLNHSFEVQISNQKGWRVAAPYGSRGAGVDFLSAWSARHLESSRFPIAT
jgi:hypothetical protein